MRLLTAISEYRRMRKLRIRTAWELSGMGNELSKWGGWLTAIGLAIAIGFLISDRANETDAEYTERLEKTLARCLSPGLNSVIIGGEIHFCGTYNTGERI